jgi:hypothetical protein
MMWRRGIVGRRWLVFRRIIAVSAAAIGLMGCHAWVPGTDVSPEGHPDPVGRILVHGGLQGPSVSFYADRVVGPAINMSRQRDETWAGWIRDRAIFLKAVPGHISSSTLTMDIRDLPDGVEMSGLWVDGHAIQNQISIRVTPKELFVREPLVRSPVFLEASGKGPGIYGTGLYGESVELTGAATLPHPPQPQFALAMLGAF